MSKTLAIFVNHPQCSTHSANGIMQALGTDYEYRIFTKHVVENNFFDDVDMICVPGGLGDASSYYQLMWHNAPLIRRYVRSGGRYLGICMGAYWAGRHYLGIVKDLTITQYIRRAGADTRRPHAKSQLVYWLDTEQHMFFYDGCAIVGKGIANVIASYPNGDAAAVIQKGVGLIGPHPESTASWYERYSYLRSLYHGGTHHKLLKNFVDQMFLEGQ